MRRKRKFIAASGEAQVFLFWAFLLLALSFMAMNVDVPVVSDILGFYGRWPILCLVLLTGMMLFSAEKGVRRWTTVDTSLLVMLTVFGFSAAYSVQPGKSILYYLILWFEFGALVMVPRLLDPVYWRRLLVGITGILFVTAVLSLYGYAAGDALSGGGGRLRSAGINSNSVGACFMMAILILWTYIYTQRGGLRWLACGAQAALLVGLYLTGSRSSLVGMIIGTFFVFALLRRYVSMLVGVVVLVFALMVFGLIGVAKESVSSSSSMRETLQEDFSTRIMRKEGRVQPDDPFQGRRGPWAQALEQWRNYPWLGNGFGVTDPYSIRPIDGSGYHGMLASVGVLGTIAFAIPPLILLGSVWRSVRSRHWGNRPVLENDPREIMAFGSGPMVGLLVEGVGEPWMIGIGSMMVFLYMLGFGACLSAFSWGRHILLVEEHARPQRDYWVPF